MITGTWVNRNGMWGNNLVEADRYGDSHVRNIRDAGYHTAMFGKTHLYPNHLNDGHMRDHAHKLHDWGYQTVHEVRDVVPSDRCTCHYADFLRDRGRLSLYQDYTRLWWTGGFRRQTHPWEDPPSPLPVEEHIDMYCGTQAANWIRDRNRDSKNDPFYLQVCFTGPHTPFDSPAEFRERFNPEDMPLAIMEEPTGPISPQVARQIRAGRLDGMTESHSRVMRTYYYAKVALIDHAVGLVVDALRNAGELDNTWIVYTSDHGDMLGDHRLNQKLVFYDGSVKVPLIIRPPTNVDCDTGWQSAGLTDHLDLSATLLEMAGALPIADSPGQSLVPTINSGTDHPDAQQHKPVVFSEVERYYAMAREERYKLNFDAVTRTPLELYDLKEDPEELHNLVEHADVIDVRERLITSANEDLGLDSGKLSRYQDALKQPANPDNFVTDLVKVFQ
ncbi:MAG: sulfatase-like hydrolase/transferase [Pseudomonadota bacterium]